MKSKYIFNAQFKTPNSFVAYCINSNLSHIHQPLQWYMTSINVHVTLICLNTALNHKHFMCMCIYAFGRHANGICWWHSVWWSWLELILLLCWYFILLIMFLLVLEFVDYENWLGCLAIITTEANWGKMVPWLLRSCHWRLPSLMLLKTKTRLVLLSSSVEKGSNCVESVHDTDSPLLTRGSSAR